MGCNWCAIRVALWALLLTGLSATPAPANDEQPRLGGSAGTAGLGFFQIDRWGIVQTHLQNPGSETREMRVIFSFDDEPERQFVRYVSVPPNSRRRVELPVRFGQKRGDKSTATTGTILAAPDEEIEWDRKPGIVRLQEDRQITAMISEYGDADDEAISAITTVRERLGLPRSLGYVNDHRLMRFDLGWDGLRVLGITTDRPAFDAVQREALRRWLSDGGSLFVFLDQVDNESMRLLLGPAWDVAVVDQVTFNRVSFKKVDPALAGPPGGKPFRADVVVEQPITMTRVVAGETFTPHLAVRDWPAVLSRPYGRGRIVVCTIGGRALSDEAAVEAADVVSRIVMPEATQINLNTIEPAKALETQAGTEFIANQVGYTVVSRGIVASVLGLFAAGFVVCGLLCHLRGRLELIGPIGVGGAIVAMVTLLTIGQQQRGQIEPAATTLQLIEVEPGTPSAVVRGVTGLFTPEGRNVAVGSDRGGWAWPRQLSEVGTLRRMNWRDVDTWAWTNLPVPPAALRPITFEGATRFETPVELRLRYTERGLTGTARWPEGYTPRSPIVATSSANIAARFRATEDGKVDVEILPDDVLAAGTYFRSGVVSDDQESQAIMYHRMLYHEPPKRDSVGIGNKKSRVKFNGPTLLAWTDMSDTGLRIDPPMDLTGQALWTLPLRVEPSEPGSRVHVPWPLIGMKPARMSQERRERLGLVTLPIYSAAHESFFGVAGSSAFVAEFSIPREVLPLDITEATLHFDITATGRNVELFTINNGELRQVGNLRSPDGPNEVTIPADALDVADNGATRVGFYVRNPSNAGGEVKASQLWLVRSIGLEVAGTVADTTAPSTDRDAQQ